MWAQGLGMISWSAWRIRTRDWEKWNWWLSNQSFRPGPASILDVTCTLGFSFPPSWRQLSPVLGSLELGPSEVASPSCTIKKHRGTRKERCQPPSPAPNGVTLNSSSCSAGGSLCISRQYDFNMLSRMTNFRYGLLISFLINLSSDTHMHSLLGWL